MFVAREAKLLAVADDRSLQEKHRVIEAEKAQVREVLKRKDLTGKDLLDVENGVLDFLANMHGAEEKWPEAVETKSQVQRVAALQKRVERLQRQLKNLSTFDYEKIYGHGLSRTTRRKSRSCPMTSTRACGIRGDLRQEASREVRVRGGNGQVSSQTAEPRLRHQPQLTLRRAALIRRSPSPTTGLRPAGGRRESAASHARRGEMQRTLACRLTPLGEGGISLIELSGPDSADILDRLFASPRGRRVAEMIPGRLLYGKLFRWRRAARRGGH